MENMVVDVRVTRQAGVWRRRLPQAGRPDRRDRYGARSRRRSPGQALVEFALVVPLFLMMLFGVVEFSLINASIGAFNFAAKDAARYGAIIGRGAAPGGNVDQFMVDNIIVPRVSGVVVAQMTEVEIFDSSETGSCVGDAAAGVACQEDIWQNVGGAWSSTSNTWPPQNRNDALSNADYLGVRVSYTYTYLTAFFAITSPTINLQALSIERIEPQEYGDRHAPSQATAWIAPMSQWLTVAFAPAFRQPSWVDEGARGTRVQMGERA